MGWTMVLPKWVDLDRRLTRLQQVPVLLQLLAVNLGPGFDKPLLRLRQFAAQVLDCVDRKHCRVFLVIRVEVRSMMLPTNFSKHPNDYSKEARDLRHPSNLPSSDERP